MISSDFDGEKINYVLILSWFCSLTFNLFKRTIYGTNDQLKFTLQEEKRLLMVEEWDEGVQSNKEDP